VHITIDFRVIWVLVALGLVLMSASGVVLDSHLPGGQIAGYGRWRWNANCGSYRRRLASNWQVTLCRSLVLGALWEVSGRAGWAGWQWLPWMVWLLPEEGRVWRRLKRFIWEMQCGLLLVYLGLALREGLSQLWGQMPGLVSVVAADPGVAVERQADGSYQVRLSGQFKLRVTEEERFRVRLLMIFLGLLESESERSGSRRTRDGRKPFVRQEQMASWFGEPQECISRYMGYWLKADWPNLLSLRTVEWLTGDLRTQIVSVFANFPQWNQEQVYEYLRQRGLQVTHPQVAQVAEQSGWQELQPQLLERYELEGGGFHLRERWLISQLLAQVQHLLDLLEKGAGPTPQERLTLDDLQTLAAVVGVLPHPPLPSQPWLQPIEQTVFSSWPTVENETVCCTYCGSSEVAPKSKTPRWKPYYDPQGQLQKVAVYRYYCRNSQCAKKSFTHFPAGLLPYSPYRTQVHVLALQMYAWGYSTYRRTGTALGVATMTVWQWVSAWGHALLPMAALFGVVKSSGVVGVDEKYVLVPKNDKPPGDMRRWMYVYLAVDVWTYDLLHIAIYPHNNQDSATAFLLALRAKGYHPNVVVTDLRQDYGATIAQVFPHAQHHECIFHALQNVQKHFKEVYGPHYAQEIPGALQLKQQIYAIFDTHCPQVAQQRYQTVLALRSATCQSTPEAVCIFDFLEHHWPKLSNAFGNDLIPTTNNTVELVIRRFDQHYQNFCGFDTIETAQLYLGVFEKIYRFTPFSQDAQERIRGKSPLQLAGYPIDNLPMAALCSGLAIDWPTEVNLVPN
jgi:transposase-like protein